MIWIDPSRSRQPQCGSTAAAMMAGPRADKRPAGMRAFPEVNSRPLKSSATLDSRASPRLRSDRP
jgi:hypothetical protein